MLHTHVNENPEADAKGYDQEIISLAHLVVGCDFFRTALASSRVLQPVSQGR
jgi:hypothetical protein